MKGIGGMRNSGCSCGIGKMHNRNVGGIGKMQNGNVDDDRKNSLKASQDLAKLFSRGT